MSIFVAASPTEKLNGQGELLNKELKDLNSLCRQIITEYNNRSEQVRQAKQEETK